MIPFVKLQTLHLFGGIPVHLFGLLVCLAIVVGYTLAKKRAREVGLDPALCGDGAFWIVGTGFAGAHIMSALLDMTVPGPFDPFRFLDVRAGLSSVGGFLGGTLAAVVFFRRSRVSVLAYAESIIFGLLPAWVIGRFACSLVHDHLGRRTTFILAFSLPDTNGSPAASYHDLGFYEMLFALAMTGVLYATKDTRLPAGCRTAVILLAYGMARFVLDYLRVGEPTVHGLTSGQWFSAAAVSLSVYLFYARRLTPHTSASSD